MKPPDDEKRKSQGQRQRVKLFREYLFVYSAHVAYSSDVAT